MNGDLCCDCEELESGIPVELCVCSEPEAVTSVELSAGSLKHICCAQNSLCIMQSLP
jgi:hypothetical protein